MRLILDRMEADETRKERTRFHFGDVMVDSDNVRVSRNGIEMKLSGKAEYKRFKHYIVITLRVLNGYA